LRWPVVGVGGELARAYAAARGVRLCTEREWEKAARGADGRRFPHGATLDPADASFGLTDGEGNGPYRLPDEVGSHPASRSPYGVDDMAGNVYEWVLTTKDGRIGSARSGSWLAPAVVVKSASRTRIPGQTGQPGTGIRVCADVAETNTVER
jgi:eukaryotic-like serine/threonine-protein kinase